jgi:hypothetical protein
MNSSTVKSININLDENQLLCLIVSMIDARKLNEDWGNRSDKEILYRTLVNQYVNLVQAVA